MIPAMLAGLAALPFPAAPTYTVTAAGIRVQDTTGEETAALCRRFRLTSKEAATYFAQAEPVPAGAYHHSLEMSQCRTLGTVRTGRRTARWSIDMERRGRITDAAGNHRYFYCPRCTSPKFAEVYVPE